MDIDWGKFFMDIGVATIIAAIGISILADFRGWKKVKEKLGIGKTSSLEEQHDNIKDVIGGKVDNIEKLQNSEFNRIYAKVASIDNIMNKNEVRYENLNLDQRDIKDNLHKLVYDWEKANSENKELKGRITELEKRNIELEEKYSELLNKRKREKSKRYDLER